MICYDRSTSVLTCVASDDVQGLLQSRGCCQTVSLASILMAANLCLQSVAV